jgi:hypothetical protein
MKVYHSSPQGAKSHDREEQGRKRRQEKTTIYDSEGATSAQGESPRHV